MKILFSLSLVVVIVTKGFTQEPTPANCQLSTILQIDGHGEEWPMIWIDDADKKVSYNVCSDDMNLYIRMKTKDGNRDYEAGQAFYWAPGHAPEALEDSEYVDFSPTDELEKVIAHLTR